MIKIINEAFTPSKEIDEQVNQMLVLLLKSASLQDDNNDILNYLSNQLKNVTSTPVEDQLLFSLTDDIDMTSAVQEIIENNDCKILKIYNNTAKYEINISGTINDIKAVRVEIENLPGFKSWNK